MANGSTVLRLILTLSVFVYNSAGDSVISGYGPVNLDDLHPLTLSWNQVHYLVRDSLIEIEELAQIHDEFYKELHDCFGLENCIKQANMLGGPPQSGRELGAGAFLESLRRQRIEELSGRHSQLSQGVSQVDQHLRHRQEQQQRQRQQQLEEQQRRQHEEQLRQQQQQQQQQRGQGGSGGQRQRQQSSSSSSSSSSFRHSRTGSASGSGSPPASSSWSSSSTIERRTDGNVGSSYSSYSKQQSSASKTSSSSGPRYGRPPADDYDDYDDGPVPNRG